MDFKWKRLSFAAIVLMLLVILDRFTSFYMLRFGLSNLVIYLYYDVFWQLVLFKALVVFIFKGPFVSFVSFLATSISAFVVVKLLQAGYGSVVSCVTGSVLHTYVQILVFQIFLFKLGFYIELLAFGMSILTGILTGLILPRLELYLQR